MLSVLPLLQNSTAANHLVQAGILSKQQAASYSKEAKKQNQPLVHYLVSQQHVEALAVARLLSESSNAPYFNLDAMDWSALQGKPISDALIRKHHVLPLFRRGNVLFVATSDPTNRQALIDIQRRTRLAVEYIAVEEDKLAKRIEASVGLAKAARSFLDGITEIPAVQRFRYITIALACVLFLGPLAVLPKLAGNSDLCGRLCMRRFYLYFPGMTVDDFLLHASVAMVGVIAFGLILVTTFFFGRIWCGYICPVGGFSELVSRALNDRWKIEYRWMPQVQIRYGYLGTYLVILPALGISACTLCNFITVPRLVEALSGGFVGLAFILSAVGLVNLSLLLLLGFFANKGRAYCQFMCPIGAIDGLVNKLGAAMGSNHRIRVDKQRCTGCNVCARNCMCGAITMVDRIAIVDQLSCMSCHECVDVCDWNAIEWTTASRKKKPKRVKKGVEIFPEPDWQVNLLAAQTPEFSARAVDWRRVINGLIITGFSLAVAVTVLVY